VITSTYTVTGLLTGTYTLTPTLAGYTFEPVTRTVSVPPDASGQDFTAVAVPTPAPTFASNHPDGRPGSTFIFSGQHLPISSTVSITINGVELPFEPPLTTDETGAVVFLLRTSGLAPGTYVVGITVDDQQVSSTQTLSTSITLDENAALRGEEDSSATALDVPTTVQPVQPETEEQRLYLPLVAR
jgi:hypothetical protein